MVIVMKNKFLFLLVLFCFILGGCSGGSSQNNNNYAIQDSKTTTNVKVTKPNNFKAIDVAGTNIYVPKNLIRISEEERMFDCSEINKTQGTNITKAGVALFGLIDNNKVGENDRLKRYDVMVGFSESPNFIQIRPSFEESYLETAFKSNMFAVKLLNSVQLISKKIHINVDGHKYLKSVYVMTPKNNSDEKMRVYHCAIFSHGKLYNILLRTYADAGNRYDKEFDFILDSFGAELVE